MVQRLQRSGGTSLLLTPNRSLSWRGNLRVWFALLVVSVLIAGGMAWAGAWLILPFAGLELSALAWAIYTTCRECQRCEVLSIDADTLCLERGRQRKLAEWQLPRRDTRIHLVAARHPWTPPRLFLMHRELEIGLAPFLNMDDTHALVGLLERQGIRVEQRQADEGFRF
ncbi:DUF2244 domain-containing protein [Marinobacter bohaiensis]|uniref:DUF2244 domain-containing protein n=1 Tax=Marinobacter bohaiensis TaxID=2201898 RepID=UPI000DAC2AE0|nr:DUF2244 domain-containing protein [Marinobacter bohaiensis]